jgi:protein Mpv17
MFINILETGSVTKGIEAIKNKFTQLMTANWRVWPIA